MISVSDLHVKMGEEYILKDINIGFKAGEITAILGPNGAGKSTLLKCLTNSIDVKAGAITFDNKLLTHYSLKELSQKRAILSQSVPVNFPFTALEIVLMGRTPYLNGKESDEDRNIAKQVLEIMDAWHLRNRVYPSLSGGEQQRVQLARVFAQIWKRRNSYLFLDEPTSALDVKHQYELLGYVQLLAKTYQLTVIIVMHDINLAFHFTDRALFIKNGEVVSSGPSQQVINADNLAKFYNLSLQHAIKHFSIKS